MISFQNLPIDILESILLQISSKDPKQLAQWGMICKKTRSIPLGPKIWFESIKAGFPELARGIEYEERPIASYWKDLARVYYMKSTLPVSLSFSSSLSGRHLSCIDNVESHHSEYTVNETRRVSVARESDENVHAHTQGSYVYDIDQITHTGVVGFVKWRTNPSTGYESVVTLSEYPSAKVLKEFKVKLLCQLTNIQTIWMHTNAGYTKMRFFSLAIGKPAGKSDIDGNEGSIHPEHLLIYRLFENHDTQFVASLNLQGSFTSTNAFFFSKASWRNQSDGHCYSGTEENIEDWLRTIAPDTLLSFDKITTVFVVVFGRRENTTFEALPFKFAADARSLDPLTFPYVYEDMANYLKPLSLTMAWSITFLYKPFSGKVSHVRYPPQLSYLVAWSSWDGSQFLFDWRFGIQVGVLDAAKSQTTDRLFQVQPEFGWHDTHAIPIESWFQNSKNFCVAHHEVTTFLPSSSALNPNSKEDLKRRGLRLVFIDNDLTHVKMTTWDISYLLDKTWNPFAQLNTDIPLKRNIIASTQLEWWNRRTPMLQSIVSCSSKDMLPLSPTPNCQPLLKNHRFKRQEDNETINLRAFRIYGHLAALLTLSNELIIVALESGNTLCRSSLQDSSRQIALVPMLKDGKVGSSCILYGIDVFNDKEIIISSSKGCLYAALPTYCRT